jgi:hypothetical protein
VPHGSKAKPKAFCRLHVERLEDRCYLSASSFSLSSLPLQMRVPEPLPASTGSGVSQMPELHVSQFDGSQFDGAKLSGELLSGELSQETRSSDSNAYSSARDWDHQGITLGSASPTPSSAESQLNETPLGSGLSGAGQFSNSEFNTSPALAGLNSNELTNQTADSAPSEMNSTVDSAGIQPDKSSTGANQTPNSAMLAIQGVQFSSGNSPSNVSAPATGMPLAQSSLSASGEMASAMQSDEMSMGQMELMPAPDYTRADAIDAAMTAMSAMIVPMRSEPTVIDTVRVLRVDMNSASAIPAGTPVNFGATTAGAQFPTQTVATHAVNEEARLGPAAATGPASVAVATPSATSVTVNAPAPTGATNTIAATQSLQALVPVEAGTPSQINGLNGPAVKGITPASYLNGQPVDGPETPNAPAFDGATERNYVPATTSVTVSQAALLATLPCDLRAVDAALNNLLEEIDDLGGDLAGWLGMPTMPRWTIVAAGAVACVIGGQQVQRARQRRSSAEETELESMSRMFTRWQGLAVDGEI